jgi:hypothetical protein
MNWKSYNGGDETEWWHVVLIFLLFGGLFAFMFFFAPEKSVQ